MEPLLLWARLALDLYCDCLGVPEALQRLESIITAAHASRQQIAWHEPNLLRQALTALALVELLLPPMGARPLFAP